MEYIKPHLSMQVSNPIGLNSTDIYTSSHRANYYLAESNAFAQPLCRIRSVAEGSYSVFRFWIAGLLQREVAVY
jgi:hypothetical protein